MIEAMRKREFAGAADEFEVRTNKDRLAVFISGNNPSNLGERFVKARGNAAAVTVARKGPYTRTLGM
jgi:hypothetical protein